MSGTDIVRAVQPGHIISNTRVALTPGGDGFVDVLSTGEPWPLWAVVCARIGRGEDVVMLAPVVVSDRAVDGPTYAARTYGGVIATLLPSRSVWRRVSDFLPGGRLIDAITPYPLKMAQIAPHRVVCGSPAG